MGVTDGLFMFLFNLETTGFFSYLRTKKQDICQIGALSYTSASSFCRYVMPSTDFHYKATAESGFSRSYQNGKHILLLKQQEVKDTVSEFQAITDFLDFLKTNSEPGSTILLIGYNSTGHDVPFLTKAFIDYEIPMIIDTHTMIIDTRTLIFTDALPLIRKISKDVHDPLGQKLATCKDKKRQTIHRKMFGITSCNDTYTHDAMRDVEQLRDITAHFDFPVDQLSKHIISMDKLVAKITKPIAHLSKQGLPKPTTEAEETDIQWHGGNNSPKNPRKRKISNQERENNDHKRIKHENVDKPTVLGTVN